MNDDPPPKPPAPQEVMKSLEIKSAVLETDMMHQKSAAEAATQIVLQFKRQLQAATLAIEKKSESQQSRIDFLTRTLKAAEKEKDRLYTKIHQLDMEVESQKDKYEQQVETMQYQAGEIESSYKAKIQAALQQLRGLREFQEHKQAMDQKMRNLSNLIAKERKERTAELASIHRKIIAQREYYEHQLSSKLFEANEYATRFNDLDLDAATTKILHQIEQRREELKNENFQAAEVIKRNDQLRHQIQDLEQQKHILEESEKNLTSQAVELKSKLEDTKKKVDESLELSKTRLEQHKSRMMSKIDELNARLEEDKARTEELKKELALSQKIVNNAEEQRALRLKKDNDLLGVMNEAAIFILTSLELQEKDPSKDEIVSHSSALNAVIRKLGNVSQDLTGVQAKVDTDLTKDQNIQTEKPIKKFVNSGKPMLTGALNAGNKTVSNVTKARNPPNQAKFTDLPEYQRLYGQKDKPTKTGTIHVKRANK